MTTSPDTSVAEAFLRSLRAHGIDTVFANAGTDFAPIIEALSRLKNEPGAVPTLLTVPHENLAVAMAHGYYLTSGKPAAVMVHVTVGTGNTICALMNCLSRSNSAAADGGANTAHRVRTHGLAFVPHPLGAGKTLTRPAWFASTRSGITS